MKEIDAPPGEIVLYRTEDGKSRIDCRFEADTLWLTQALVAELFQKNSGRSTSTSPTSTKKAS